SARRSLCRGGDARAETAWDGARRSAVGAAFAATGRPYAESVFAAIDRALDGYRGAWAAMHRGACEATRLRGEQPENVLALRMACLDRRLDELSALGDLFARADGALVDRAIQASGALT